MAKRRKLKRKDVIATAAGAGLAAAGLAHGADMKVQIHLPDEDGLALKGVVPVTVIVEPISNLRSVSVIIDGATAAQATASPFTYQWDTTKVADGTHIIGAVAQYKTRKSTAQIAVTVNNTVLPPPPPPPPTGLAPKPVLENPIVLTVPSQGQEAFATQAGRDYDVRVENGYREGPLRFSGAARHVLFQPFEHVITDTTSTDYGRRRLFEFRDITGTIHLENYYGRGVTAPSLTEGINIWTPGATLQLVKSRIEGVKRMNATATPQHPDVIQTWSGPKNLRLVDCTVSSDYQGFLTMAVAGQPYPGTAGGEILYHRVNCHVLPNAFTGAKQSVPFIFPLVRAQRFLIGDFYVGEAWIGGQRAGVANAIYERANEPFVGGAATLWDYQLFRADGTPYQAPQTGKTTATWLGDMLTVNQDDYIEFINPTVDNLWNLDATSGARVRKGIPAGGDYMPA